MTKLDSARHAGDHVATSGVLSIPPKIYREYAAELRELARTASNDSRALYLKMAILGYMRPLDLKLAFNHTAAWRYSPRSFAPHRGSIISPPICAPVHPRNKRKRVAVC